MLRFMQRVDISIVTRGQNEKEESKPPFSGIKITRKTDILSTILTHTHTHVHNPMIRKYTVGRNECIGRVIFNKNHECISKLGKLARR